MTIKDSKLLLCDCGASMTVDTAGLAKALDLAEVPPIHRNLCRAEVAAFQAALTGQAPVLVGCTQEAPLFADIAEETDPESALRFANIRERAGWGDQGRAAGPKIAALLAEAAVERPPTPAVEMHSGGRTLVYGHDETAIEAARRLAGRMDVTVVLRAAEALTPPRVMDIPIHRGRITRAEGHLGAFALVFDDFASADPMSRHELTFDEPRDGITDRFDLILDLSGGQPLFTGHRYRDGYFAPDPGHPAAVERALFDLTDMVGTFDKPRYVAYQKSICAHARNRQTGCTKCLDLCPAGAIQADGDGVAIDPHICGGCGLCASVCPTGAASYDLPPTDNLFERLRVTLSIYGRAGGGNAVLLCHDPRGADDLIAAIGRFGGGLPANVIPFAVNEVSQIGLDFLTVALAQGAMRVVLLAPDAPPDRLTGLTAQIDLAETVVDGLGYGGGRVQLIDSPDPEHVETRLNELAGRDTALAPEPSSAFLAMGGKRDRMRLALAKLHEAAPEPVAQLPLPSGAPFGAISVDTAGCTMCLACVSVCPTDALSDNPDTPELGFREANCVQCGLCRVTCPESVITLEPRLDFTEAASARRILNQEAPANCVRCGKAFGVQSTVDRMVEKLRGHAMFADDPAALDRIRMCEDCRVAVQFEARAPMAGAPRPRPRTSDDYLAEPPDNEE